MGCSSNLPGGVLVLSDLPSAYTFQNGGRKDAGKTWTSRETQSISTGGGAGSDGAADHSAGGQGAPGLCGQKCPGGSQPETGKAGADALLPAGNGGVACL